MYSRIVIPMSSWAPLRYEAFASRVSRAMTPRWRCVVIAGITVPPIRGIDVVIIVTLAISIYTARIILATVTIT